MVVVTAMVAVEMMVMTLVKIVVAVSEATVMVVVGVAVGHCRAVDGYNKGDRVAVIVSVRECSDGMVVVKVTLVLVAVGDCSYVDGSDRGDTGQWQQWLSWYQFKTTDPLKKGKTSSQKSRHAQPTL